MRWSDELTLIAVKEPENQAESTNENGFTIPREEETRTTVFANKKSVGFNEFFKAKQAGDVEEMKFDIFSEEFGGEKIAEYKEKRYKILRTYVDPKTEGEYTELTLTDLSEGDD